MQRQEHATTNPPIRTSPLEQHLDRLAAWGAGPFALAWFRAAYAAAIRDSTDAAQRQQSAR